jgi:hypothetical protein
MEIPLEGTSTILSFFADDTIETIRQTIALAKDTHPDRLFIEIQQEFPADYYATNPKRWMELFYRISLGKESIKTEPFKVYLSQIRTDTGVEGREISKEEWLTIPEYLVPIFAPKAPFKEWRILGVPEDKSLILPTPPRDNVIEANLRPVPVRQSLFESVHTPEQFESLAFRTTEIADDTTESMKQAYFPFFQSSTPRDINTLRGSVASTHERIGKLLKLKAPKPSSVAILRAKWYIPLISTKFSAPRTRFEQIFYGMTVSKETPAISYFTAKQETTRHKFYVEDPKTKEPFVDIPMWKSWMNNTQPQRRLPTLLLYRGTAKNSFDRIAITNKDIVVSTWRSKESTETLEDLKLSTLAWLMTFDALIPFMVLTDLDETRWEINELSVIASYSKEISEFDMRRFGCMTDVFSYDKETFRLLRANVPFDVPQKVLEAYKVLQNNNLSRDALMTEMSVSESEADELLLKVQELESDEHFNFEKALNGFPAIVFSSKEVIIKFVSNLDRAVEYASLLRYVLTSDRADVDEVCPRRMEVVQPALAIAQMTAEELESEFVLDDELGALLGEGLGDAPPPAGPAPGEPAQPKKVKVRTNITGTYNYFNNRARDYDSELFDAEYPKKCEKLKQVVVLTDEQVAEMDERFNYSEVDDRQKLSLPNATAICPPYWCMKDELPLTEEQLVVKDDGKHCPVCDGKIRVTEKEDAREYTIIKRESDFKYPGWKEPSAKSRSKNRVPCCYKKPSPKTDVIAPKQQTDEYYILTNGYIPGLRLSFLPEEFTTRVGIKTDYAKNAPANRINAGATETFRIGMGLPRKTLPVLLGDKRAIPQPKDAKDKIQLCSFFRTWKTTGDGDNPIDRIVDGIDRAFTDKTLGVMEEIEYVSLILDCRVMRIKLETSTVQCGFWEERLGPRSRTIVLLDSDVLGRVTRRTAKTGSKFDYVVDLNKFPEPSRTTLKEVHLKSCVSNTPTYQDAINELIATNKSEYQVILDPFGRIQAVFIPEEVVLPVLPVKMDIPEGVVVRSGYADIHDEELPTSETLGEFLNTTKNPGFKWADDMYSASGQYTEFLLTSGFRAPFRPESGKGKTTEVVSTVRKHTEEELVSGEPNDGDTKLAKEISYAAEVFEFLLFSLSKDIQMDEFEVLRNSITNPSETLYKDLSGWLDTQAYWDAVNEPVQFVNKVRTPCGQMAKDSCNKSTLCGWKGNVCKIKIRSIVDRRQVLTRLVRTLTQNTKQRALVLDGRLSPFFSTILYLQMPNEWITTQV